MKRSLIISIIIAIAAIMSTDSVAEEISVTPKANPAWANTLQKYRRDSNVKHLIFVQCLEGSKANIQVYEKDDSLGTWSIIMATDGFIGRCGYSNDKREGDSKTPTGEFGIITAFGIKPNPDTSLPYLDITDDLYAVDTDTQYYNQIVSTSTAGLPIEGEHMWDYSPEYNYGIFLDYNKECKYGKGSAIFFHCKGAKPYTGGCVAVDEDIMKNILQHLTPKDRICIFPL